MTPVTTVCSRAPKPGLGAAGLPVRLGLTPEWGRGGRRSMCASLQGLEQKAREPAQLPERACVQTGGSGLLRKGLF